MKVADIKRAACVGGGVIGSSWAIQFAARAGRDPVRHQRRTAQKERGPDATRAWTLWSNLTPLPRSAGGRSWRPSGLTTSMEEAVADRPVHPGERPEAPGDQAVHSGPGGSLRRGGRPLRQLHLRPAHLRHCRQGGPPGALRGGPPLQSAPPHPPGGADLWRQDRPRPAPAGLRLLPVHRQGGRPPAPGVPRLHRQPAPAGPLPGGTGSGDAGGVLRGGRGQGPGLRPPACAGPSSATT